MAKHIDLAERRSIERAIKKGKGVNEIARMKKRSKSTISMEIKVGSKNNVYSASYANTQAKKRRKQSKQKCLKVAMDPQLKEYVTKEINNNQTSEAVSGRLKKHVQHIQYASPKAIYHFVYSSHGGPLEHHLHRKRVHRKGGPKRGKQRTCDKTKHSIEERPTEANNRTEFGHFEGDFVVSGRDGKDAILVLVERKTRYPFLVRITDRSTESVNNMIAKTLCGVPIKSITLDNDISFVKHEELSMLLSANVYFTHPYTSQDKGTVENRNKVLREFIPKGSDISQVSDNVIQKAELHMRTRYMKCLEWYTPQEVWNNEILHLNVCNTHARVQKNPYCTDGLLEK